MKVRTRFWFESTIALVAGVLAVVTAAVPDWIETVFGVDPDGGNGAVEWGITIAMIAVAIVLVVAARLEYRRSTLSPQAVTSAEER